jgi:hypothetical protein
MVSENKVVMARDIIVNKNNEHKEVKYAER